MLKHTFCHIHGIGAKTERDLWAAGVTSWDCEMPTAGIRVPRRIREHWPRHMQESLHNHGQSNPGFFIGSLPASQEWRLYEDFQGKCAFVDIETTGLDMSAEITTIVLYDGRMIRHYVNGQNLGDFRSDVRDYALLVTYNGKSFDVPRIKQFFFDIQLPKAHIDLRHHLASIGLKRGLKRAEERLGIDRPELKNVDGLMAILLWGEYQRRGDVKALETLLAYNVHDTVSLHALMVHVHNKKIKGTPFARTHSLSPPSLPEAPFTPDRKTLRRILRRLGR
jgi:uncharacterized protein YprB with RNaseH-like and TPR domain